MNMHAAAGLTEVFLTAYQALVDLANVQSGERVLIHAGASGVGLAAIQVAQYLGCDVAVTVSNQKKQSVCLAYGANLAINYNETDFVDGVRNKWKQGVDVIIDVVGGDYVNRNLDVISTDGRIVNLAMLGGRYVENFDLAKLLSKRVSITGSTLRNRSQQYKSGLIYRFTEEILPAFSSNELKVPLDSIHAASELRDAHALMESNQTAGKLIGFWPER
jgi:NADPH:quinone reductase-like Zn-dependent oxidoreductase